MAYAQEDLYLMGMSRTLMKASILSGFSFGLTSGIITTLGLIVGLNSATADQAVVLGGIMTIAIADALSDALGIHVSEESKADKSEKQVWAATASTLLFKFLFAASFILPVVFLELGTAIAVSMVYGLALLAILSFFIARSNKEAPWRVIAEHLVIAVVVIFLTHYVGQFISSAFG